MLEEVQIAEDSVRTKRKRRWKTIARIFSLVCVCVLLPFFIVVIWTGYLTWIGIAVGVIYLAPGIVSPIAGLVGKKRLESFLSWLGAGMPILAALVVAIAVVYKATKVDDIKPVAFAKETGLLIGSIFVFVAVAAGILYGVAWLVTEQLPGLAGGSSF